MIKKANNTPPNSSLKRVYFLIRETARGFGKNCCYTAIIPQKQKSSIFLQKSEKNLKKGIDLKVPLTFIIGTR